MNLLFDGLPSSVTIAGREVPISTGFRTGIRFERLLRDDGTTNREKLDKALRLYYKTGAVRPSEYEAAVDALLVFYRCGAPQKPKGAGRGGPAEAPPYDYEHDAAYIYAAFKQAYNVDLAENDIHWWQFRALFLSLPEDTMLMKVIGYRTAKVPANATPEQRQRIEELKRVYALPLSADQQKLTTDLEAILMAGGDPADLLAMEGADRSWHSTEP